MTQPVPLDQRIREKIAAIDVIARELPGVVIIHNRDSSVAYISPRGEKLLGATLEELKNMGTEYNTRFFNPEDAKDYIPKLTGLLQRNNDDECLSFFQQVRISERHEWVWHISSIKIFMRNDEGEPIMAITFSFPIDPMHHLTAKVSRLLEENNFLRRHYDHFAQLGNREKEVLKLQVLGKSSPEIAEAMNISVATVETHRKNIKKKLAASTNYDLAQYARAFDLI